ncbi:hypothetical protein CFC21_055784 [Triticum aestivum]|uniref:Leucine-rich repeat-containing N-terminal plant-type domain-containing protein n=2 Tax=Triticum aestivum TaxID=4565 RepID=A0A3B6I6K5_WHEAT|nr:hypothetical protein CFC21_055784 [Triticum aestivum]
MLLLLALLLLCNNGIGDVEGSTIHDSSIVDLHALLDFKLGITDDPRGALSNWSNNTHFCRWNGVNCTTTPPFRVRVLNLSGLNITGKIRSSLGNMTFLAWLDLSSNNFVGPILTLDRLQQLDTLYLYDNHLHGTIPDSLTNCSSLALVGVIPPKLHFLSHLFYFNLSLNSIVGQIPPKLGFLSDLTVLDLSVNSLVGQIPPKLGLLSNLIYLDLSINLLVGQIPPSLGFLPNLAYIHLRSNQLEGSIPRELGQLLELKELFLSDNKLSGELV